MGRESLKISNTRWRRRQTSLNSHIDGRGHTLQKISLQKQEKKLKKWGIYHLKMMLLAFAEYKHPFLHIEKIILKYFDKCTCFYLATLVLRYIWVL